MKILHAYNKHRGGGGADNAPLATIAASREHGLEVEVFTRDSESLPSNLAGRFRAATSAFHAPESVAAFTNLLDSFQPDVVHLHEVFPLVSPWILPVCSERGVPVVMTCVDYRLTCPIVTHLRDGAICTSCLGGREYNAVLHNCRENLPESVVVSLYNSLTRRRAVFRRHVNRFVALSDFSREWFSENGGIEADRINVIAPAIEIPPSPVDPATGDYVAFAGRFSIEKGIHTLGEAARLSGLPFRMARNERNLVTIDMPSEVEAVVTRDRDDLATFYRGARMLVFPSIWFETFGIVGAEAMSHGVPVVASRIGALANLVEDGVDGLLFDPGDSRDLADKVTRLWNDPELCRRLGQAARTKAEHEWNPRRHFERHLDLYREL